MTIQGTKKVLVNGIVGELGKAVVPKLLSEGHDVRVITDHPDKLKGSKAKGVEVVQGDTRKREDLLKALDGVDGALLIGVPHEEGAEAEVSYGKAAIDACLNKDIKHVVYSSVCCADKAKGVPHFEAKHEVEDYLKKSGLSCTILRPVWYMENFTSPRYLPSIERGVLSTPIRPEQTLKMVSAGDVGRIVAEAFSIPGKFSGREIDIAADKLTMTEVAERISDVMPRKVRYEQMSGSDAEKNMSREMAAMFQWMDEHGYDADLVLAQTQFKRYEIPLTSFRDFLDRSRDEFRKAA